MIYHPIHPYRKEHHSFFKLMEWLLSITFITFLLILIISLSLFIINNAPFQVNAKTISNAKSYIWHKGFQNKMSKTHPIYNTKKLSQREIDNRAVLDSLNLVKLWTKEFDEQYIVVKENPINSPSKNLRLQLAKEKRMTRLLSNKKNRKLNLNSDNLLSKKFLTTPLARKISVEELNPHITRLFKHLTIEPFKN